MIAESFGRNLRKSPLEVLGTYGKIILKFIINIQDGRTWAKLLLFRTGTSTGPL
jgi:hypothetical protein